MPPMECRIDTGTIQKVVYTLKQIDVRGYDSMDRLVGLVMLFENCLQNAVPVSVEPAPGEEAQPDGKGD